MLRSAACTFSRTGRSYTVQKWYNCETCDMRGGSHGQCQRDAQVVYGLLAAQTVEAAVNPVRLIATQDTP
jgi:hypothetical protein